MNVDQYRRKCDCCGDVYPRNKKWFGVSPKGRLRHKCLGCLSSTPKSYKRSKEKNIPQTDR